MKRSRTTRTLAKNCVSVAALIASLALASGWAHVPEGNDADPLTPTVTISHRDYAKRTHRYFTYEAQSTMEATERVQGRPAN